MLKPVYLRSFEKEIARDEKRGKKLANLRKVMNTLIHEEPLPSKHRNHKLKGEYEGL
jgi:mRNA interferase YafQ